MKFGKLNLGVWHVVQFPSEMPETPISEVFTRETGASVIYVYDKTIPGGTMVAARETLVDEWQGDLTTITANMICWFTSNSCTDPLITKEDLDKLLRDIYSY